MKTFVVLGMHRSATSMIARGLSFNNVYMGNNIDITEFQPWGHWEDHSFWHLNDFILHSAGGTWANPPPEEDILRVCNENHVQKTMKAQVQNMIEKAKLKFAELPADKKKNGVPMWGWKDPRTTLTIKGWLPFLTNPHFICCFRQPLEVAESLNKRDKLPIDKGLKMWQTYNKRLLDFLDYWSNQAIDVSPSVVVSV